MTDTAPALPRVAWDRGACWPGNTPGINPEAFFPPIGDETYEEREAREREAKRACAICPIQMDCLQWATETRESFAVYGGMSERQRDRLRAADPDRAADILTRHQQRLDRLAGLTDEPAPEPDDDYADLTDDQLKKHVARLLDDYDGRLPRSVARDLGVCTRAHRLTDDNLMPNGRTANGRPRWRCRTCYEAKPHRVHRRGRDRDQQQMDLVDAA